MPGTDRSPLGHAVRAWLALAVFGIALSGAAPIEAARAAAPNGAPKATPGSALPALDGALAARRLPDGGWLMLDTKALRLLDAAGRERDRVALRAKLLDLRWHDDRALVLVLDANTQEVLRYTVESGQRLVRTGRLAGPQFGVEAMCAYRDAQGLDQVVLIGAEGLAEQWVLQGEGGSLVRQLALPPDAAACAADDAAQWLYVSEPRIGVWAYRAEAEGGLERWLAVPASGALADGVGALAVLRGGVAVADRKGRAVQLLRRADAGGGAAPRWQAEQAIALPKTERAEALAVWGPADAPMLAWGKEGGAWTAHAPAWKPPVLAQTPALPIVLPRGQTDPVARRGDAADDPAIWVHPSDPTRSRVLGTNKKQGLLVYDLAGRERQLLAVGRLNNVDVRQRVRFAAAQLDLAVATQRDENALVVFAIDGEGQVSEAARLPTGLNEVYGVCLYQPPAGGLQVFVDDKDGRFERYRIEQTEGRLRAVAMPGFKLASQPEACVADDRAGRLYIGEEKRGVWVLDLARGAGAEPELALRVGGLLHADVEGLALHHGARRSHLVISSQGNSSYVVADAAPPYTVRGAFRVGMNLAAGIDGTSETDGIELSTANFGGAYAGGLLVVQDGYKRLPDGPQNFKYVAWEEVLRALGLE